MGKIPGPSEASLSPGKKRDFRWSQFLLFEGCALRPTFAILEKARTRSLTRSCERLSRQAILPKSLATLQRPVAIERKRIPKARRLSLNRAIVLWK